MTEVACVPSFRRMPTRVFKDDISAKAIELDLRVLVATALCTFDQSCFRDPVDYLLHDDQVGVELDDSLSARKIRMSVHLRNTWTIPPQRRQRQEVGPVPPSLGTVNSLPS